MAGLVNPAQIARSVNAHLIQAVWIEIGLVQAE
jgi:hypothetical protein